MPEEIINNCNVRKKSLYLSKEEEKLTFKAQELALWYDRDERDSDWNKILSSTKKSLFSVIDCTLCVTPYHSESYLGFGGF